MANDRNGNPIVLGDTYVVAGAARVVDGSHVLVVLASGEAVRVASADVLPIDDLGGAASAHSSLSGLSADDHPQYVLANGTRAFTGPQGGVAPVSISDFCTKNYTDSQDLVVYLALDGAKQPVDPTLTALAGHVTSAGTLTKWTGVDTCSTITLGAFGETMIATATAAAGRAALELDEVYSDAPMQNIAMNVVAYVDLLSKSLTVVAGDTIEVEVHGTLLNNSAAVRTYRVQAEIAVVPNILQCECIDGGSIAANATNRAEWWIRAVFSIKDATNAGVVVEMDRGVPSAANTGASTAGTTVRRAWQTSASDFTGSATVEVRMRSDNATATQTFTVNRWKITRKPKRL